MNQPQQTIIGFDFGTKRIGVAVGQTITQTAAPLVTVKVVNQAPQWSIIDAHIKKWQPDALVVGVPLNMDGTEQSITQLARQFARSLAQRYNLTVHEMDERLSTVAARDKIFTDGGYRALKKTAIDSIAAQLIVENWLRTIIHR